MSNYIRDIQFNLVLPKAKVIGHKQALLALAQHGADYLNISEKILYQRLSDKEELATSAIGDGVAIPHLKMRRVRTPFAALMTLEKPVKCGGCPDHEPVDIYSLIISPMEDSAMHLRRLSRISRLLKNASLRKRLRETSDSDVMRSMLIDPDGWMSVAA